MTTVTRFTADWCQPCKVYGPVFDEVGEKLGDSAIFLTVDVEEQSEYAFKSGVSSIPATIITVDGEEYGRRMGALQKQVLEDWVRAAVNRSRILTSSKVTNRVEEQSGIKTL